METEYRRAYIAALIAALTGMFLSALLIMEYHGAAAGLVDSLCRAGATVNTCRTVASSPYAALRGLPLFGDIPVALFGFSFYGLSAFLAAACLRGPERRSLYTTALFALSILALLADIVLFIISFFIIKTMCNLCTLTYGTTALMLTAAAAAFTGMIRNGQKPLPGGTAYSALRTMLTRPALAAVIIVITGMAINIASKEAVEAKIRSYGSDEKIRGLIRDYQKTPEVRINTAKTIMSGDPGAPVSIIIFSDFTCNHCATAGSLLEKTLQKFSGKIRVYYKNFPLAEVCASLPRGKDDPDAGACIAAYASRCAWEQGKFAPVYKGLYFNNGNGIVHNEKTVTQLAGDNGLDVNLFLRCLASEDTAGRIKEDADEADRLEIVGTPTVFINGKEVSFSSMTPQALSALIRFILQE